MLASTGALHSQTGDPDWSVPIDYDTALRLATTRDPGLRALDALEDAAAGQVDQAALRPNPTVSADVENILGTGDFRAARGTEVTVGISQVLETGGKRARRTDLAGRERDLVAWDREERLAALAANVRAAFVEVLLAQEAVALAREQLGLARQSLEETGRLVDAARSPEVERTRASLAVRQQAFAVTQAERAMDTARQRLAALWGLAPAPDFTVSGDLALARPQPLQTLAARLPATVAVARYEAEEAARRAGVGLEQARAVPDVEGFGGVRYAADSDSAAFVVGVQMPWPLFDRNQGNIRSARARLRAVVHEREATRRDLLTQLATAHADLVAAYEAAQTLQVDLRPAAEQTLRDTQAGYDRGQFTLLSVLESRLALFGIRAAHLDALRRYATAKARIEALTRPANVTTQSTTR